MGTTEIVLAVLNATIPVFLRMTPAIMKGVEEIIEAIDARKEQDSTYKAPTEADVRRAEQEMGR